MNLFTFFVSLLTTSFFLAKKFAQNKLHREKISWLSTRLLLNLGFEGSGLPDEPVIYRKGFFVNRQGIGLSRSSPRLKSITGLIFFLFGTEPGKDADNKTPALRTGVDEKKHYHGRALAHNLIADL